MKSRLKGEVCRDMPLSPISSERYSGQATFFNVERTMSGGLTFHELSGLLLKDASVSFSTTCWLQISQDGSGRCHGALNDHYAPCRNNRIWKSPEKSCAYEITNFTCRKFGKTQIQKTKLSKCLSGLNTWMIVGKSFTIWNHPSLDVSDSIYSKEQPLLNGYTSEKAIEEKNH